MTYKPAYAGLVCALLVSAAAGHGLMAQSNSATEPERVKALIVSGGCCHDYTGQNKILIDAVSRAVPVDWTVVVQGGRSGTSTIPVYDSPEWYEGYDIVVHNECFTDVADPEYIRRITRAHHNGVPGMFLHCSLHSYRAATVDDWREVMGGTSFTHPEEDAPVVVRREANDHPIVSELPPQWTTPVDELYIIEKFWPGAQALAVASSPDSGNVDFPVIWTRDLGGTRMFVTSLGHGGTWTESTFHELIVRGFQWALGREVTGIPAGGGGRGGA